MLLGCCHCGEDPPSESVPPSESNPPSDSEIASESGSSQSESASSDSIETTSNSCILTYGCMLIPRALKVSIVTTGTNCHCQYYNGTFKLDFIECRSIGGFPLPSLFYGTAEATPKYSNVPAFPACSPPAVPVSPLAFGNRHLNLQVNSPGTGLRTLELGTQFNLPGWLGGFAVQQIWSGTTPDSNACLFSGVTLTATASSLGCTTSTTVTVSPW